MKFQNRQSFKTFIAVGLIFLILSTSSNVLAVDQQWLSLQADRKLSDQKTISLNFHRRDSADLYTKRLLNLYRLHYIFIQGNWQIILGAAYFDRANGSNERRLHQYFERDIHLLDKNIISTQVRLGLEERHFNSDNFLYLRFRARAQFHIFPQRAFGPTIYHESFYIPNGQERFASTFNESRSGVGLRYALSPVDLLLFHTFVYIRSTEKTLYEQWWQLQISFPF